MADKIHSVGTEFDGITPEVWSASFFPTLLEKLPFVDSVARDYESEIQGLGDTININTFPQFGLAEELTEGQRSDADSITPTKSQLVINKRVVKDYILTKKALQQSIDAGDRLRELAMHSIIKKMQAIIIAEITPSASAPDHQISYDSATTLALADILEAKELLDTQDVEDIGRVAILDAPQKNDLFNITGFTSRDFIPDGSPLAQGDISTPVLGFTIRSTTEASNVAYFFHPIFLQMAVQQEPEVGVYDLGVDGKRGRRVNMDVLFGVKQVSDLRVVTVS